MNLEELKKPFKGEDIEWRIAQAGKKGNGQLWATCLAYISARAIMDRLDEVCGPNNWKVAYRFIPGENGVSPGVICELSIYLDDVWITKEDGAEQTDIESFKGGISSALKRAGSAWGIGRYLYGLETGFATILKPDEKGGRYAKSKTRSGEFLEFHWLPPNLPAWALPHGAEVKPRGIHPDQPNPGDGTQGPNYKSNYKPVVRTKATSINPLEG